MNKILKRYFRFALMAAMVCGLSFAVTSCKDDERDGDGSEKPDVEVNDDKHTQEAMDFLTCVSLLCDVYELPDDWRSATFEPTVGTVTDESRPTVRTVYVADRQEAAIKFLSLIPLEVEIEDVDMTTWHHDDLGTLTFNYQFDGVDGCVATLDVQSPRIPQLEQIRYVSSDAMPANGSKFLGLAYYQLGDVVKENNQEGNEVYWVCVRPSHPDLKDDSHWVSLSYAPKRIYAYTSDKYPRAYVPTCLGYSEEHITNFCQLLYFMRHPRILESLMMDQSMAKGLGGLNGIYDDEYVDSLAADWEKLGVWNLFPELLRQKINALGNTSDTLSFFVNGYHSLSYYLQVDKAILSRIDNFVKVKTKKIDFKNPYTDFRPWWQDGDVLVLQYRKGANLQSGIKGDMSFDQAKFTDIYRYRKYHNDLDEQDIAEGHYQRFDYKTISATGDSVVLSGLMGWPESNVARDIIVGCHITITNNSSAPTQWKGAWKAETGQLMAHTKNKGKRGYNSLVVISDYEGYGNTVSSRHPYLCQEVTAHQVADAAKTAKRLFLQHGGMIQPGFKTISVGYSQGGSVAMATHRYIEQHPDLKDDLNFAGSLCGDGPYDPLATFETYFSQGKIYMPVVMSLVLNSYCAYDPDMRRKGCTLEDYLTPEFLASGIVEQIYSKRYSTKDIQNMLQSYVNRNRPLFNPGKDHWWYLPVSDVVKENCIQYFEHPNTYAGADKEKYEALRNALMRNRVWGDWPTAGEGWNRTKPVVLFHGIRDEVVPFVNYDNAKSFLKNNYFGQKHNAGWAYGHIWVGTFFYAWYEVDLVEKLLNNDRLDGREVEVGGIIF